MRVLSTDEFEEKVDRSKLGRPTKYPWGEWLRDDLTPVEIVSGEDFDCKPESLRQQLARQAKERELKASLIKLKEEGHFAIVPEGLPEEGSSGQAPA